MSRLMELHPDETSHLISFEETMVKTTGLVDRMGGFFQSRQAIAVLIVLFERIEQLEKRLDANGIYQ